MIADQNSPGTIWGDFHGFASETKRSFSRPVFAIWVVDIDINELLGFTGQEANLNHVDEYDSSRAETPIDDEWLDDDFNELAMHHKSMENLATGNNNGGRKKNTGLELVRLLRVGITIQLLVICVMSSFFEVTRMQPLFTTLLP